MLENNPKMFEDFTLTSVRLPGQIILHVTPLLAARTRILELLGLSPDVYSQLAENGVKPESYQRKDRSKVMNRSILRWFELSSALCRGGCTVREVLHDCLG